ncbi:hypothetical protein BU15DRAFT_88750 [Melanogaster broomeanus]|nr:hypothetical protein BU15DRAFT_88750 [Melanogaster broomeanus]
MTSTELDHIADQLLVVLNEMRSYTSTTLGSVTGGPYNNRYMPYPWHPPHAFSSVRKYLEHYRNTCFPTEAPVYFTHGDLLPGNILYCRMHDPGCMTPGWTRVLARIFPGLRREREIAVVYQIIGDLHSNSPFLA